MFKNTAGQKWVVFAFDLTDNTAKTGDAANITANLRLDGGAANAVDDTNPAELERGYYVFDLTQAETNADLILIAPASSTGDIQVIGVPGALYTTVAMRGTDGANTTVPDAAGTAAALHATTDGLITTVDTVVDGIKAVTDNLPDSGALTAIGADTARLTAARAGALTDWIDGGRLDNLLDAIPTTAMRGTDGANTTVPDAAGVLPTAIEVADAVLIRGVSNVEDSADRHSLGALVMMGSNASIAGVTLTAKKPSNDATFATYTLTVDALADPATGIS